MSTSSVRSISVDGGEIRLDWPIREIVRNGDQIYVLLDPDVYLNDEIYRDRRKKGAPAIQNLIAFRRDGVLVWEAELPEASDYYYKIVSTIPLVVNSFSSYRCEIDKTDGTIRSREFLG